MKVRRRRSRRHPHARRRRANPFRFRMRAHRRHRARRNSPRYNRRRRHARRNPAESAVRVMKPMTYLPHVAAGAVSAVAVSIAPALPILSSISAAVGPTYGPLAAQVAMAAGGAMALPMIGFRKYAMTWLVVGLAIPVANWLRANVLAGLGIPGLSAYPRAGGALPHGFGAYPPNVRAPFGAYPAVPRLNAFPVQGGFSPAAYNPYAGPYSTGAAARPLYLRG